MRRELWWWLGACAAGLGLTALAGGIIGPEVALFALVALAGWLLIRYEGPSPAPGPDYFFETGDEVLDYPGSQPATSEPVADEHGPRDLVVEDSTVEDPVFEDPVFEDPADEDPAVEDPADEKPIAEDPADEKLAVEDPAVDRAGSG